MGRLIITVENQGGHFCYTDGWRGRAAISEFVIYRRGLVALENASDHLFDVP